MTEQQGRDTSNGVAVQEATAGRGQTFLVEVAPGIAAVFGDAPLAGFDVIEPLLLPDRAARQLAGAVAATAVAGNVAAQAAGACVDLQGLVRLSPETIEALRTAKTVTQNGFHLGILKDANGLITHSVRWTEAYGSQAALGLAAIGPAVALAAIQHQLASLTALAEESLATTDQVLKEQRIERWAEVTGLHRALGKAVAEARHVGAVTDPILGNVQGQEMLLGKQRDEFRDKVQGHLAALRNASDPAERHKLLERDGEAILRDSQAMVVTLSSWLTYQALRAAHLYGRDGGDHLDAKLLEDVIARAQEGYENDLAATRHLLLGLHREFSMLSELGVRKTFAFGKAKRAAQDVAAASALMVAQLARLEGRLDLVEPPVQKPVFAVLKEDDAALIPRVLRWHLDDGEQLLALAEARDELSGLGGTAAFQDVLHLAVTDRRILVADRRELRETGDIRMAIPLSDVRYVRCRPTPGTRQGSSARVDLITKDVDLRLVLTDRGRNGGEAASPIGAIAQLLASHANLPSVEVPPGPLLPDNRSTVGAE